MAGNEYEILEETTSLCPICMERINAQIILKNNSVFLLKHCKEHGKQIEILEEDSGYFLKREDYNKKGTPSKTQIDTDKGCPLDCGLCSKHEQHTCMGLIEVTNQCDLNCPVCYAQAGGKSTLDIKKISEMMDFYQDSEFGKAEILQISGGEPTTHPDIIEIIKLARKKKFKYVMLNTNGLRIAKDEEFVRRLGKFKERFEIYFQFDGFGKKTYEHLRGRDLLQIKEKAIQNMSKYKIPITLVCTVEKGVNDSEIGRIIEFAQKNEYIRGVNFQPICFSGRLRKHSIKDRITLTGVLRKIEEQTNGKIKKQDFIPLPCNIYRVAINYLYRSGKEFIPLAREVDLRKYVSLIDNTFYFDADDIISKFKEKKSKGECCFCNCLSFLKDLRRVIPEKFAFMPKKEKTSHINRNTFRISVSSFIDAYNFDAKSMKRECAHIITPDMKKIPFSSYNLFYRK